LAEGLPAAVSNCSANEATRVFIGELLWGGGGHIRIAATETNPDAGILLKRKQREITLIASFVKKMRSM
jgi:hypothetical protein